MVNLIKADVWRILKKPSFYVVVAVACAVAAGLAIWVRTQMWNGLSYVAWEISYFQLFGNMIAGIAIFTGVYADEFRAKSIQSAIGRGISRPKIVAAKIIDCAILTVIVYAIIGLFLFVLGLVMGANPSAREATILALAVATGAYVVIGLSSLAAIILYMTENIPLAVFADVGLYLIVPMVISLADMNRGLSKLHLGRFYYIGFSERAYTDMVLGGVGEGLVTLGVGFVIYVGLAYLLSTLVFSKKELEF